MEKSPVWLHDVTEWVSRTKRRASRMIFPFLRTIILITLAYQLLYPILYMFSMAIREASQAADPSVIWIPKSLSMQNFVDAFKAMKFIEAAKNGLIIGLGCGFLDVGSCALAGYSFARLRFWGSNALFLLVILGLIVPTQTIMLPLYSQMRYFDGFGLMKLLEPLIGSVQPLNLIGSWLTMYMPALVGQGFRAGLFIFLFRQVFRGMPSALEEAAYIDGCGMFKTFTRIMLPNAKNTIITVFLFSFVWHWNEYYLTRAIMGSNRTPAVALSMLRVDIANLMKVNEHSNPLVMITRLQAGSLLVIAPLLLIYIFTQRYFTDSIEHVGIK